MHRGRPFAGIVVASAVGAGLVLSHWLAYLIAVPHAHERERLLEQTGHGYWPRAAAVAAALNGTAEGTFTSPPMYIVGCRPCAAICLTLRFPSRVVCYVSMAAHIVKSS